MASGTTAHGGALADDVRPRRITDILSAEDIRAFTQATDAQGALSVLTTWSLIAASFGLVAWRPAWWTVAVALVVLGGRHLALAILMHECSHHSLFRTRAVNDWVGKWLCAAPSWNDLHRYRTHHLTHHAHTGTDRDNDLGLVEPFPTTRWSLVRKLARDLLGLTGLKRLVGLPLMDLGFLTYSASTGHRWIPQRGRTVRDFLATGARNLGPVLLTNALLWAVLAAVGHGELYALWIVSYLTTFSLFLRIRSMAEHACTARTADQFLNTRTTRANWLARLTVAPHHVNYHLEHHLLMTVPHYRLRALHARLRGAGVYDYAPYAPGYGSVLRQVVAPQPTAA